MHDEEPSGFRQYPRKQVSRLTGAGQTWITAGAVRRIEEGEHVRGLRTTFTLDRRAQIHGQFVCEMNVFLRLFCWRETGCGIAEYGAMVDAEGFDPALLAEGETDEKTELDQLWDRKMAMQICPELVAGDV